MSNDLSLTRYLLRPRSVWVSGPDPIGEVMLPWTPGVTALYGRNGAGKTRLLRALTSVVRCEELPPGAGGALMVDALELPRVDPVPAFEFDIPGTDLVGFIRREIKSKGYRTEPGQSWSSAGDLRCAIGDLLFGMFTANHEKTPQLWDIDQWSRGFLTRFTGELVETPILFLEPKGDGDWSLACGVAFDNSTPTIDGERTRIHRGWDDFERQLSEAGVTDIASSDAYRLLEGETFASTFGDTHEFRYGDSPFTLYSDLGDALANESLDAARRSVRRLTASAHPVPVFRDLVVLPGGDHAAQFLRSIRIRVFGDREFDIVEQTLDTVKNRRTGDELRQLINRDLSSDDAARSGGSISSGALEPKLMTDGDPPAASPWLRKVLADLTRSANEYALSFLIDAPPLECHLAEPTDWFSSEAVQWIAWDQSGKRVSIDALSEAQGRWARNAIDLALHDPSSPHNPLPVVDGLCLDEPDAALHASAERHLVEGLVRAADELQISVLVSTHSREFLNHPDVNLVHVTRDHDGLAIARSLDDSRDDVRSRAKSLGLESSDLLQRYRVLLIVEGHHDKLLLDTLIGSELDRARTLILAMRGGPLAATVVDAQLVNEFSDAVVVLALDNLNAEFVGDAWARARSAGSVPDGQGILEETFTGKRSAEQAFIREFCIAALRSATAERFSVFGFSEPDIIDYLPVEAIAPGEKSWTKLRNKAGQQSFKPWLLKNLGIEMTDELLASAIGQMDHVPEDFTRLAEICRQLSLKGRRHQQ